MVAQTPDSSRPGSLVDDVVLTEDLPFAHDSYLDILLVHAASVVVKPTHLFANASLSPRAYKLFNLSFRKLGLLVPELILCFPRDFKVSIRYDVNVVALVTLLINNLVSFAQLDIERQDQLLDLVLGQVS